MYKIKEEYNTCKYNNAINDIIILKFHCQLFQM